MDSTDAIYTHETHPDRIEKGKRIRLVYDAEYQTVGSFAYDTEEETHAAEQYQISMLESYQWVVLGRIEEARCCECGSWKETESLWGIVVDNTNEGRIDAAFNR